MPLLQMLIAYQQVLLSKYGFNWDTMSKCINMLPDLYMKGFKVFIVEDHQVTKASLLMLHPELDI